MILALPRLSQARAIIVMASNVHACPSYSPHSAKLVGEHLPRHTLIVGVLPSNFSPSYLANSGPRNRKESLITAAELHHSSSSFSKFKFVPLFSPCSSVFPGHGKCRAGTAAAVLQRFSVDDHSYHDRNRGDGDGLIPFRCFLRSSSVASSSRRSAVLIGSSFYPQLGTRARGVRNFSSGKSSVGLYRRRSQVCNAKVNSVEHRRRTFPVEIARSFPGDRSAEGFGGYSGAAEDEKKLPTGLGGRGRRVVARASAAAAGSSSYPSRAPNNWWSTALANFFALCASFASRLESTKIGWLDVLTVLRIAIVAVGAFGAYVGAKKAWVKIRAHAGKSGGEAGGGEPEGGGGGGDEGPMQVLARGATCLQSNMGPWSASDLILGLTAMAKVTEKQPPALPGQEVKDLSQDSNFLLRAQHWRTLSEAVYVKDSASFSLFSGLPESSIVAASWEISQDTFRPAYAVVVDPPYGAVVLAVRGTSQIVDMLVNSGASPEPIGDGGEYAHGGFVHASNMLHEEVLPIIEKAFKDHSGVQKELKLVIIGHSMGAAVGSLVALKLREKFGDLECWGFCPPASMSLDLAKECKSFVTSFVAAHDIVPRFSLHSVENLRTRIQEFDWDEVEKVAKDDEDWQNIKKGMDSFRGVQQFQSETMDKLKGSGVEDSESLQKVKNLGKEALKSETGEKIKGLLGDEADADIGGGNENENKGESEEGEGKDGGEEVSPPNFHPPGRLLVLGSDPPGCGKMPEQRSNVASERKYGTYPSFDEAKRIKWRMFEAEQEDLEEIVVSPWCISDHMLGNMCEAIGYFQSRCPAAIK